MWEDSLFVDTALPFGLRSAPKIFSAVADAVEWVNHVLQYLDDILVLGPPGSDKCQVSVDSLLGTFAQLGIPVAASKTEGPATCPCFLGIEIDTISLTIRLPANKMVALQDLVRSWLIRSSCLKKELKSMVGSLSHACCVVRSCKTFLRMLFELLSVARRKHHYLRLFQVRPLVVVHILGSSQPCLFLSRVARQSVSCILKHWVRSVVVSLVSGDVVSPDVS